MDITEFSEMLIFHLFVLRIPLLFIYCEFEVWNIMI